MTNIQPFYFGSGDALFGIHHPPVGPGKDHAVLIAPPLMNEYMRSHYALRLIALNLADAGFDVLRFDFLGTGNSGQDLQSVSVGDWAANLEVAADELSKRSNARYLSLVAVRFAAGLAAALTHRRQVESLVMWDPILDGEIWRNSLRRGQENFVKQFPDKASIDEFEIMGYITKAGFEDDLVAFRPGKIQSQRSFAVTTEHLDGAEDLRGSVAEARSVTHDCGWERMTSQVLYPREVVDSLCGALA